MHVECPSLKSDSSDTLIV